MKTVVYFIFIALSVNLFADGIMSIQGSLIICDKVSCQIKDKNQIFTIALNKLTSSQQQEFKAKKVNEKIHISIPMSAIKSVEDSK